MFHTKYKSQINVWPPLQPVPAKFLVTFSAGHSNTYKLIVYPTFISNNRKAIKFIENMQYSYNLSPPVKLKFTLYM